MTVERFPSDDSDAGTGLGETGLCDYSYPVMAAWRVGGRPKTINIKVLARTLRSSARRASSTRAPRALPALPRPAVAGQVPLSGQRHVELPLSRLDLLGRDRCLHRQADGGPDAAMSRQAAVKSCPVRERRGAVWVFVGDIARRLSRTRRRNASQPWPSGTAFRRSLQLAHHDGQSVSRHARAVCVAPRYRCRRLAALRGRSCATSRRGRPPVGRARTAAPAGRQMSAR